MKRHPFLSFFGVCATVIALISIGYFVISLLSLGRVEAPSQPVVAEPAPEITLTKAGKYDYLEVTDGCDSAYVGTCVNMRTEPSTTAPVVERLRTGVVLKVEGTVRVDGHDWYKIAMDKTIAYPERVTSDWYVYADAVTLFTDDGDEVLTKNSTATKKNIYVNLSEEMLYAYEDDVLFMQEPISTGLELTPTPPGTFTVFRKTPSRYMQGPLKGVSGQVYDLPGVPWDLYFTEEGAVIHGAYWHDKFGQPWSHGCVNLSPQNAKKLYLWADIGTTVIVRS